VKALVERAAIERRSLGDVALADPRVSGVLSAADVSRALDPSAYLGSTDAFIDRALATYRRALGEP
jgi:adenylosuccinate lyase